MQPLASSDQRHIGDCRLEGVLGRGGQGTVYLGQNSAGVRVAVKVINAQLVADPNARRRFEREADAARAVAPFCTARVLDAGIADGRPYIASEFIAGPTLDLLVTTEGVRSGSGLERLAVATLTALAAIHRAGIVHRDFKPSNVIMGAEGPVVIDFGIARALDQTVTSTVIGTPAYMAPEQFESGAAGPALDLFSWAGTMVFAATGRPAFSGETTPAMMRSILDGEPDLTGLPPTLRPLLEECLAKDPRHRPKADELLRRLTGEPFPDQQPTVPLIENQLPPLEPSKTLEEEAPRQPPEAPLVVLASVLMGVAVVLGLASMILQNDLLANISFGIIGLAPSLLGAAVWRYQMGAGVTLASTFPLGLVYLYWAVGDGPHWSFPYVLLWAIPFTLLGVALIVAAVFLRQLGNVPMVLGVAAGALLVTFTTGRWVATLPEVEATDYFFNLLITGAALGVASLGAWLVLICAALVRESRRLTR